MGAAWFSRPVSIATGISGDIRYVENAQEAVAMLTHSWRTRGSRRYLTALRTCQRAVHGDIAASIAHMAFVEAAMEARVLAD